MAREANQDVLLARAIDSADERTLRKVLRSMCQASEACRKEARERMLVSRKRDIIELSDSSDNNTKQNKRQKKVEVTQVSRFEKCQTCDETYDVTLNNNAACQKHTGELAIDPDVFPDDDDVQYDIGSIDVNTDWRREEWPEGFIWQCCDKPLNSTACQIQRHIPKK
ncbi:hypothetical protein F4801DRAFT_543629 [Xylaria longipes]|nr:hypothetical protein F4801DRAFT_543629 [Xylaria longipes]RYC65247.1 hypothetical protein CHU98_g1004 [Xylaria longipes]